MAHTAQIGEKIEDDQGSSLILCDTGRFEKKLGMTNVQWVRREDVGFVASINPQPTNQPTQPGRLLVIKQSWWLIPPINFLLSTKIAFSPFNIIPQKRADGKNSRYRYSEDFHKLITPLNQGTLVNNKNDFCSLQRVAYNIGPWSEALQAAVVGSFLFFYCPDCLDHLLAKFNSYSF